MLSPAIRNLCLRGLEGSPLVFRQLLAVVPLGSPRWDFRPHPERFALREIPAHLADLEEVNLGRFERIVHEAEPDLPDWDPWSPVLAGQYRDADPVTELERFARLRNQMVRWLEQRSPQELQRGGSRPRVGHYTHEQSHGFLLAHDQYHLQQITEYLTAN